MPLKLENPFIVCQVNQISLQLKIYQFPCFHFHFLLLPVPLPPLPPTPYDPSTLKGGSWISTGHEASRFARFAFRRHFFQHAGFRLVRSTAPTPMRVCNVEVFVLGVGVSGKILIREGLWRQNCKLLFQNVHSYLCTSYVATTAVAWHI